MTSKPVRVPEPAVSLYLTVKGAADAIEYYKKVFGAEETMRLAEPDGKVGHAEIMIGGSPIMISDEYPELDVLGPESRGGTTVGIHIYVEDADEVFSLAVAEGGKVIRPVKDQFYGDRSGKVADPFGHVWYISTRKEDLSAAEMTRRYDEQMKH